MASLQAAEWHDMFVAIAGAAAALTGLFFVAVSINLTRILEFEVLPTRAVETLSIMIGLLLLSVIMLVPGQAAPFSVPRSWCLAWRWPRCCCPRD